MRKTIVLLLTLLTLTAAVAQTTNVLVLTWNEPIGSHSTLFQATNLLSGWSEFSTSSPPVSINEAAPAAFFYVHVEPSQSPDILIYTNNPNSDGLRPANTNGVGIAYDQFGNHGTYYWSPITQSWN